MSVERHGKASGFSLIDLLVVIAIIAVLDATLCPVFAKVREKVRKISCVYLLNDGRAKSLKVAAAIG